jgi:hypothetical protein
MLPIPSLKSAHIHTCEGITQGTLKYNLKYLVTLIMRYILDELF